MVKKTTQLGLGFFCMAIGVALFSCDVQFGTPTGGTDSDGKGGDGTDQGGQGEPLCGERTVNSIPGPGSVTESFNLDSQTTPEDSSLAAVLGLAAFQIPDCPNIPGFAELILQGLESELEVGEGGVILSRDGEAPSGMPRFAVEDGCLILQFEDEAGAGNDNGSGDSGSDTDLPFLPDSEGCEEGQFAVGPEGAGDTGEGYICVSLKTDFCVDCTLGVGVWSQRLSGTATYRALGAIAGVQYVDLCTQQTRSVDIAEGDTAMIEFEIEIRYTQN